MRLSNDTAMLIGYGTSGLDPVKFALLSDGDTGTMVVYDHLGVPVAPHDDFWV